MSTDNSASEEYLKHVTAVGDKRTITATEDILGNNGVKVLAAGHKVNSALLETLLQHKLLKPIDYSLWCKWVRYSSGCRFAGDTRAP